MNEPRRLIEQSENQFEHALLEAGRSYGDSTHRRMKVLAAVGIGSAIAAGSKASFAMAAGWKKLMLGSVVAGSSVTAAAVVYQNQQQVSYSVQMPILEQVSSHYAEVPKKLRARPVPPIEQAEPEVEEQEAEPVVKSAKPRPATGRSRSPNRASSPAALQAELALLDRARTAVSNGSPTEALRHLATHSARFPQGSLGLEAEVLRIQALAASGRREEASTRARRILARSPNSVVASRLRRYIIE